MITRYDCTDGVVMEPEPDGEWIRFLDHEAEIRNLEHLILVLRGFRPNRLCPKCRAPRPCTCGYGAEKI